MNYEEFEKFYYEFKPYGVGLIALIALANYRNKISLISGIVLAICSALIFYFRHVSRK